MNSHMPGSNLQQSSVIKAATNHETGDNSEKN